MCLILLLGQACSSTVQPQVVNIFIDFKVLISEIRNIIDSLIALADAVVEGSDCEKALCAIEMIEECPSHSLIPNMTFREYDFYNGQVALCLANDAQKTKFYQALHTIKEFLQYGLETLQELIEESTPKNSQIEILNHGKTDNRHIQSTRNHTYQIVGTQGFPGLDGFARPVNITW